MVAIEGIDAAGKTTQSRLLTTSLHRLGLRTVYMSFPDYHTPIGREIKSFLSGSRNYPVQLQHMLFAANRWEKSQEITSYLRPGVVVVVNRYTESNLAYGTANGLEPDWLDNLEIGMPKADLVVVLDAPPRTLNSRRPPSRKDAYERNLAFQARVQKAYRELAPERGWKILDASGTVQRVHSELLTMVKAALTRGRGRQP